jgi:hypothetical protein
MTDEQRERLKTLLLSGGVSGALLGGGGSLLGGARSIGKVGKAAAIGALLSGGLSAGSGMLGEAVTPRGDPDDPQANTKRGAIGGGLAGGLVGAGAGALLAGKSGLSRTVKAALMRQTGRGLLSKGIGKVATPLGGALGIGALGAAVGAYQGSDEGMQADFIENLRRDERRRRLRDEYA